MQTTTTYTWEDHSTLLQEQHAALVDVAGRRARTENRQVQLGRAPQVDRSVAEITRERSSAAVKAALKALLEAPATTGGARGRARRIASVAAD